ncbi:unnamed protein product [Miscanthus lutarioriparius]|uniref:MATH domain-containing protein n=1 Tax=Miscanthus lutarioriparius TaxID=422564 RepID=A0A811QQQ0_9POAL|nr:unnamed protein product [Miscanthus lutarioriparius]
MGNCCVAGASSDMATFKWSIDNFSSLLDKGEGWTNSRVFKIMGHAWHLKLNPMDRNSCDEECVSLRLQLSKTSVEPNTIVDASFRLIIYDQLYGKDSEHHVSHTFQTASTSSGKSCMIKLAALKNSSGFLVNNNCVFGVKFIKVVTTKAKTTSEKLFVKNASTLPEAKAAYTWCIADFFGMENPGYSPEFTAGGYKWSIRLDKEENHISLYLKKMINDLPEDSAVLVEFTLSIKNQEGGKHLKKKGLTQFSNNDPTWGWEKVVSMEDIQDSSNGYLIKTKCCIEAEVTTVGSSKMK